MKALRTMTFLSDYFSVGALRKLTRESIFFQLDNRISVSLDSGNRISCQAIKNSSEIRTFKSNTEDTCLRSVQILAFITQFSHLGVLVWQLAMAGQSSVKAFTV